VAFTCDHSSSVLLVGPVRFCPAGRSATWRYAPDWAGVTVRQATPSRCLIISPFNTFWYSADRPRICSSPTQQAGFLSRPAMGQRGWKPFPICTARLVHSRASTTRQPHPPGLYGSARLGRPQLGRQERRYCPHSTQQFTSEQCLILSLSLQSSYRIILLIYVYSLFIVDISELVPFFGSAAYHESADFLDFSVR
jgi:hypothetical protein